MTDAATSSDAASLHPARRAPSRSSPIFVIGSVRSGTSAVGWALTSGAGIPGHSEGHVTTLLQMVCDTTDLVIGNHPSAPGKFLIGDLDAASFKIHVANYIATFIDSRYPSGKWVDKSPDDFEGSPAIRSAPLLLELFPNARFIYCLRRGIENVLSRQKKFPQTPFYYHCRSWAQTVTAWHGVRGKLGDRWMEVRQEALALEPERVSREMASFLGLTETERAGVEQSLRQDRPEQSRPAGESQELGYEDTGWDGKLIEIFEAECGQAMALAGYAVTGRRMSAENRLPLFWSSAEGAEATILRGVGRDRHLAVDRTTFTLGPPPRGERATLNYPDILLGDRRRFSTRLVVTGPSSQRVRFGLEVRNLSGTVLVNETRDVANQDGPVPLEARIPDWHRGVVIVTLWTELQSGKPDPETHAAWVDPAFHA